MSDSQTFQFSPNATAKQVLAAIDQWASQQLEPRPSYVSAALDRYSPLYPTQFGSDYRGEGKKLWNIISAMRGPDNDDVGLKMRTTAVLRAAVLPSLAKCGGAFLASGNVKDFVQTRPRNGNAPVEGGSHFASHIFYAAQAITG